MKTIEERAEGLITHNVWDRETPEDAARFGYIQGAKDQKKEDLEKLVEFMLWLNNTQPVYAKNPMAKNMVRECLLEKRDWDNIIRLLWVAFNDPQQEQE